MALHYRKDPDGNGRILTDSEAAVEDEKKNKFIAALVLAGASSFVMYLIFGDDLATPLEKVAMMGGPILGFFIGWRIAHFVWIAIVLALLGGFLWFAGNWIFS